MNLFEKSCLLIDIRFLKKKDVNGDEKSQSCIN